MAAGAGAAAGVAGGGGVKDERRVPSCQGKRLYGDLPTARKMARRTNSDRDASTAPYHCCTCHGWHVGAARKTGKRPRKQELAE